MPYGALQPWMRKRGASVALCTPDANLFMVVRVGWIADVARARGDAGALGQLRGALRTCVGGAKSSLLGQTLGSGLPKKTNGLEVRRLLH